jgi:hypothetical protein
MMRTTLDIDDDVLLAAKEIAAAQKRTAGKVLSELARRALRGGRRTARVRNGFSLLPSGGRVVTAELVEKLLEEES